MSDISKWSIDPKAELIMSHRCNLCGMPMAVYEGKRLKCVNKQCLINSAPEYFVTIEFEKGETANEDIE